MYTDAQIQSFLATRINKLKSNADYTVRQIFSKFIADFDANERRQFGKRIKSMVERGLLPLRLSDTSHKALKYAVL